jgi:ubiquinone/menaquinone biosynthesis C-methylase UbiE
MHRFYPESQYGGFSNVDGTIAFYARVNALIQSGDTIVDYGCGRGAYQDDPVYFRRNLRILRGKCQQVIGLDVDPGAARNPFIDEFRLIQSEEWPLRSNSINLCLCDYVLEHIQDPDNFFSQCHRILQTGGYLCIRTSNLLSYFGLMTKLLPERTHTPVLSIAKEKLSPEDKFKVLFRCNTVKKITRMLEKHGFQHIVLGYDAEPGYLSFSGFTYWLGVIHQRYAPNSLKVGIFAFAQKA